MWSLLQGQGFALQLPDMPSHVKALITESPDVKVDLPTSEPVDLADWYAAANPSNLFEFTCQISHLYSSRSTCAVRAIKMHGEAVWPCRPITEADLQFFKDRVERDVELPGAGSWQHMTDLTLANLTYSAWRRRLPVSIGTCST